MLPDDPVLRGRLLRCARLLLAWSQARLAHEASLTTGTVYAVEAGRFHGGSPSVCAVVRALQSAGVVFLPATEREGPGLRYAAVAGNMAIPGTGRDG